MKNILVTFDYELFLGSLSGTVQDCMLKPTDALAGVLQANNAKAIFFVDSYFLHVLKQQTGIYPNAKQDYEAIQNQLTALYNAGHYIYYHIHPHWMDASYNPGNNTWNLPSQQKYCFSDLDKDGQDHVFAASVAALNEILVKVNDYKQPDGYRAGGLYMQPFTMFRPYFKQYGIKYEFSVLPDCKGKGIKPGQQFDFTGVTKRVYNFEHDVAFADAGGSFTEYTLEVSAINGIDKILNKLYNSVAARTSDTTIYGKGLPTTNRIIFDESKYPAGKFNSYEVFTAENLNRYKVGLYLEHLKQTRYLHLLSHPKLMSPHSVAMLDLLLREINKIGQVNYDFKKIPVDRI